MTGGGNAGAGGESGGDVSVFGAGVSSDVVSSSPAEDSVEISRAFAEHVWALQETWRLSMSLISLMSLSRRSLTSPQRLIAFLVRLAGREVAAAVGGDGATGKGASQGHR